MSDADKHRARIFLHRGAIWTLIQYLTAKAKKAQPDKKTATGQ